MQLNRLPTIIFRLSAGNRNVFGIMLLSAALVILIRVFGPLGIGWDLSIQLEAAYRLIQGFGLTNAFSSQLDLNQPPISEYLTHFPPGLSLLVAAFLFFQIPLAIALKIMYGITTVLGWTGWAIIGARCLLFPIKIGGIFLPIHLIIAVVLPIFYTPSWTIQGTDIFLWAGVPIILLLLLVSSESRFWLESTILAGLGFGLLLSLRYASGFLLLAALLIIFYLEWPKWKQLLIRYGIFLMSFLLFFIPICVYLKWVPNTEIKNISSNDLLATHGARYLSPNLLKSVLDSLQKIVASFSELYYLTGIQTEKLETILAFHWTIEYTTGMFFLFFIIYLSFYLIFNHNNKKHYTSYLENDILRSLAYVLISFIVFSVALTFVISYSPLVIDRYYFPVQFCLIFIMYRIITLPSFNQLLKWLSKSLIFAFLLYSLILRPTRYYLDEGRDLSSVVLGAGTAEISDISYPSNKLLTSHEKSIDFLAYVESQASEDNLLFFIQDYPEYMKYANFQDPLKFRRISDSSFWNNAYLSQSTKIIWVINRKKCPSICASDGNFNSDNLTVPIKNLTSLPNLKVVFTNPSEETKIMVSDLPAGYHFKQ